MSQLLTIAEAATKVNCSQSFIQKKCKEGVLPSTRIGKNYRIQEADLQAFLNVAAVAAPVAFRSVRRDRQDDLLDLMDGWIAHLTHIKALSPATIRTHHTQMRTHLKRLSKLRGEVLSVRLIFERRTLMTVMSQMPATSFALKLNTYNAVISFGKFLVDEGKLDQEVLKDLKNLKPRRQVEPRRTHLKSADVPRLFDAILTRKRSVLDNATFAAVVAVMVYGGLRVSEVCNLRVQDIDLDARVLSVRHGKGGKDRRIGIGQSLYGYLRSYIAIRPTGLTFFAQEDGTPYNKRMVQKRLTVVARRLNLDITCHGLRRSFATLAANQGRSINALRIALGHTNLETTQAYLRTSEAEVVREMATW